MHFEPHEEPLDTTDFWQKNLYMVIRIQSYFRGYIARKRFNESKPRFTYELKAPEVAIQGNTPHFVMKNNFTWSEVALNLDEPKGGNFEVKLPEAIVKIGDSIGLPKF